MCCGGTCVRALCEYHKDEPLSEVSPETQPSPLRSGILFVHTAFYDQSPRRYYLSAVIGGAPILDVPETGLRDAYAHTPGPFYPSTAVEFVP